MERHGDHKISYVKCECYIDSLKKYFGKTRLSRITSGHIEGYRLKILSEKSRRHPDRPVSHSTINRQVEILRTMLARSVRWGLLTKNPAQQVEDFDEDNKRERFLSTVEIRQLLRVSKQTDSPILRFSDSPPRNLSRITDRDAQGRTSELALEGHQFRSVEDSRKSDKERAAAPSSDEPPCALAFP